MSTLDAWQWLKENWNNPNWTAIPCNVRQAIGIDSRVGIYSGVLVTKRVAKD